MLCTSDSSLNSCSVHATGYLQWDLLRNLVCRVDYFDGRLWQLVVLTEFVCHTRCGAGHLFVVSTWTKCAAGLWKLRCMHGRIFLLKVQVLWWWGLSSLHAPSCYGYGVWFFMYDIRWFVVGSVAKLFVQLLQTKKLQYHCDKCGICRTGGQENYFHCDRCGCCYSVALQKGHTCVEKSMHQDCPVCMEVCFSTSLSPRMYSLTMADVKQILLVAILCGFVAELDLEGHSFRMSYFQLYLMSDCDIFLLCSICLTR